MKASLFVAKIGRNRDKPITKFFPRTNYNSACAVHDLLEKKLLYLSICKYAAPLHSTPRRPLCLSRP